MVKPALIELHPDFKAQATCPQCRSENSNINKHIFQGIHVLIDCTCRSCNSDFFHTLPIAHDSLFPIAFTKNGKAADYPSRAKVWLAEPLISSVIRENSIQLPIEKLVFEQRDEAILLNCLDDCFGHVYTKLWNAQFLLEAYPDKAVIVLIPENASWLVPKGVCEIWSVKGNLSQMKKCISNLDEFVRDQKSRFLAIYLSTVQVYVDTNKVDFNKFLKMERFDISKFNQHKPTVTFVLREDRFWHTNRVEELLNRLSIKLSLGRFLKELFVWRQNILVKKTIKYLFKKKPHIKINIAGLGNRGMFPSEVRDLRVRKISYKVEQEWCRVYSESHLVIGVHGSNMLIPTSLSAGFIEILPEHKIPHIGEDTVMHHSGRYAMLLGRHVDAFITPGLLSEHIMSMLDFGVLYDQIESNLNRQ